VGRGEEWQVKVVKGGGMEREESRGRKEGGEEGNVISNCSSSS
jgi:hypothetical protein